MSKARTLALVLTLTGAAFLNTLTIQAVVIVLPTIGRTLDIPAARQQWIVSAYSLSFGCFLLLWGRLADIYGKKPIFVLGTLWVAILTLVNPFMTNEIAFDLLRGLQGVGGAGNVPTAFGILSATFPEGKARNRAFSFYASGAPMGSIMGNLLGGVVLKYAKDWRWVFWVLSIMAFAVAIAGYIVIPQPPPRPRSELKNAVDWIGAFLVTVGVLILFFALTQGNVVGWRKPYILVLMVLSIACIVIFVFWQLYLEKRTGRQPLIKVSLFKRLRVSAAMLAMTVFFSAFNNYLIFSTYFYQEYLGLDAIHTTLRFIPTGVVGIITILATSQLLHGVPVNYLLLWGMPCVMLANLLMAVPIPPTTTYWAYGFPAMCLAVLGADTLFPSLLLLVAQYMAPEDQALGGGLINAITSSAREVHGDKFEQGSDGSFRSFWHQSDVLLGAADAPSTLLFTLLVLRIGLKAEEVVKTEKTQECRRKPCHARQWEYRLLGREALLNLFGFELTTRCASHKVMV
ncbi:drug resistance protein [Aureobasidium subglaciale]|nr:drug resistance protein [Aureobasidium subglaciale]KAI5227737.1 drug resistance protein [Aureobasidium subglaciale]KAI5263232.1 drug resistance protein [Aureobasidium subglaciale]